MAPARMEEVLCACLRLLRTFTIQRDNLLMPLLSSLRRTHQDIFSDYALLYFYDVSYRWCTNLHFVLVPLILAIVQKRALRARSEFAGLLSADYIVGAYSY